MIHELFDGIDKDYMPDWPLHGAKDHQECEAILDALRAHGNIDGATKQTGVDRAIVANVARWYQSLWLGA